MDAKKLVEIVRRRPFEPMRIHMSHGAHFDVLHPEQLFITKRWSYLGIMGKNNGDEPFEDDQTLDNVHIVRVGPIPKKSRAK